MADLASDRLDGSVVGSFLSKAGLVLSRVKDTMVADFLEDLRKDGLTWEQFMDECDRKNISGLNEFIDRIITRLGFDLSAGSKKIQTTVKGLIASSIKLGNLVQELVGEAGGTDWARVAEDLISDGVEGKLPLDTLKRSAELFSDGEFMEGTSAVLDASGGIGEKLKALIEAVQEVVSIIRQFSSLEWESIADDAGKFADHVSKTYFTKAFGKRILDYVLLLLLKHAKEVFMEDILAIADDVGDLARRIKEELADSELGRKARELAEDILRYKTEMTEVMSLIEDARKQYDKEAREFKSDAVFVVPVHLATRLDEARKCLYAVAEEAFSSYFSVATVFNRTYAILDLMGLIKTEELPISTDGEKKTKVQVQCLYWSRIGQIFTEPLDYLSSAYAIYDLDDAEKLLVKVIAVARSFNGDFPDFSSIKQMIWELLIRIRNRLEDKVNPVAKEMYAELETFKNYLISLLKSMEALALTVKDEVTRMVDGFLKNGKSAIADLKTMIDKDRKALEDCIKPLTDLVGNLPSGEFTDLFIDPLVDAVREKAPQYLSAYSPELMADQVRKNLTEAVSSNQKDNIVSSVKTLMTGFSDDVKEAFSEKHWKEVYKEAFKELKKEFEFQTRHIPSLEQIRNLSFSEYKNPFSDLDIFAFADIITERLESAVPFSPDKYGEQAEDIIDKVLAVDVFKGVADISAEGFGDDLKAMAQDVLISWWSAVQQNLRDRIVQPVVRMIRKAVKKWFVQLLRTTVIPAVNSLLDSFFKDVDEFRAFFGNAGETAVNLLLLATEAKEMDSWSDGLRFVVRLYGMIPAGIKKALGNLIDLPEFDFDSLSLPDYTLDVENRFLAVTVWNWSGKNADAGGTVSLQLVSFVAEREVDGKSRPGLYFFPVARGTFGSDINLGKEHHLTVSATASLNDGVEAVRNEEAAQKNLSGKLGFFFYPRDSATDVRVLPLADSDSVSAFLSVLFSRGQSGGAAEPLQIVDTDVVEVTLGNYPQKVFIGYAGGLDAGYQGKIEDLKVRLKLRELNGFFETILKNDIEITLKELMLGYSLRKGFDIDGSFHAVIPIRSDIDLKVVHLSGVNIELGGEDGDLIAKLTTTFTVDLDCVTVSFPEMGVGCTVNVLAPGGGPGTFDLTPRFQFPNGLGLSIDAECVKGAGLLQWKEDEGRFLAALSLEVVDLFSANGLLLFTLGAKGKPFSMMAALSAFFNPGIQLGMGFSLTAFGGSLGVNRRIDTDKMRDAVRDGSLGTILFIKDLDKHIDSILSNVTAYFPQTTGQFFFGAMAELTWSEIFKVDFGLFLQAPDPVSIIIAGGLHMKVADSAEKLLALNAYFLGEIDFARGLSFDAELVDTCLAGLDMYGSLALRILWGGDTKGFLLSAGGFHPQYTPEPGFKLSDMKRIGMKLDYKIVKFSLETYFAVTSNTVQFGANAQLKIGWDKFGLHGYFYFDTLFQFNPFAFLFDVGAGVAVKVGSVTLMSISLKLSLGGPAPWHAKGSASFWFLFVKIKVNFDQTWGRKQKISEGKYIDLLPVFAKGFADNSNWAVITSDTVDNLVQILPYAGKDLMMNPSDALLFSQKDLPLGEMMEKYGEAAPGDMEKLSLSRLGIADPNGSTEDGTVWLGGEEYRRTRMSFAPSLIRSMDKDQKLSAASYEDMDSGFALRCSEKVSKGPSMKVLPDRVEQETDPVDWDKWVSDAEKLSGKTSPALSQKAKSLKTIKVEQTASPAAMEVVMRPSHRRNKAGFERYVRQMDLSSSEKYERLTEKVKEVSDK